MLSELIKEIIIEYRARSAKKSIIVTDVSVAAPHAWDFDVRLHFSGRDTITIRHLTSGHHPKLKAFKHQLSPRSRELVPCYPWDNDEKLEEALRQAIAKHEQKIDAAYLIELGERPIGHFFLWKAGGNPHSLPHGVDIPELGVAVADEFQGQGLGSLSVKLLQAVAHSLEKDAIELTTAVTNNAGWHTYVNAGFAYTGDILNPLDVDVTDAFADTVQAPRSRIERQMVYIISQEKKSAILNYLARKREESEKFSGH